MCTDINSSAHKIHTKIDAPVPRLQVLLFSMSTGHIYATIYKRRGGGRQNTFDTN